MSSQIASCPHPQLLHPTFNDPCFPSISYRQLVSRASTQRLHSPSLDESSRHSTNTLLQWELDHRKKSRSNVLRQLLQLGMSWDRFVQDIQSAEQEIHILSPTRYHLPDVVNRRATTLLNQKTQYRRSVPSGEWREMYVAQMQLLRMFARVRVSV